MGPRPHVHFDTVQLAPAELLPKVHQVVVWNDDVPSFALVQSVTLANGVYKIEIDMGKTRRTLIYRHDDLVDILA